MKVTFTLKLFCVFPYETTYMPIGGSTVAYNIVNENSSQSFVRHKERNMRKKVERCVNIDMTIVKETESTWLIKIIGMLERWLL